MRAKKIMRVRFGVGGILALGFLAAGCDQITSVTPSVFLPPLSSCTPIPSSCSFSAIDITANINGPSVIVDTTSNPNNFDSGQNPPLNPPGFAGPDQVFCFTLCNTRHITLSTCGGATWDTVLVLKGSDCTGAALISPQADDDACKGTMQSEISELLDPGLYHVVLDGYAASSAGPCTLTITTP